jgi:hypothetical protein
MGGSARSQSMRQRPPPPPTGWRMEVFEVVPGLSIGTRLAETADYNSLGVDVAAFAASLVGSGRKVLVHCTEVSIDPALSSPAL